MRDVGTGAHHARTGIPVRWPGAAARSGAPSTSRTLPGSQRRRLPVTPLEQAGPGLQGRLGFPEPPPRQEGAPRPRDEGNGQAVAARGTRPLGTAQAARASGPRPLRPAVPCRAFLCSGPPVSHVSGLSDIRRCGHRLFPGGMGMAPACSERFVQTSNVGELWAPGLTGS